MLRNEKRKLAESESSVVHFSDVRNTFGYALTGIRREIDTVGVQIKVILGEFHALNPIIRKIQKEIQRIEDLREKGILQFDRQRLRALRIEEAVLVANSERLDQELRGLWREERKMKKQDAPLL